MRRNWKRWTALLTLIVIAVSLFVLLTASADNTPDQAQQTVQDMWAGRRKTTPTPKPDKTPKPSNNATATPKPTPTPEPDLPTATPVPDGPIIEPQAIADWLFSHDFTLPDNFITKKEAQALGWQNGYRYVSDAAPGKSIGGDYFGNYEQQLPTAKGRRYYECDCWYEKGPRNAYRIIFSNDGLVFYTEDHYQTFVQMFPSIPEQPAAP